MTGWSCSLPAGETPRTLPATFVGLIKPEHWRSKRGSQPPAPRPKFDEEDILSSGFCNNITQYWHHSRCCINQPSGRQMQLHRLHRRVHSMWLQHSYHLLLLRTAHILEALNTGGDSSLCKESSRQKTSWTHGSWARSWRTTVVPGCHYTVCGL